MVHGIEAIILAFAIANSYGDHAICDPVSLAPVGVAINR